MKERINDRRSLRRRHLLFYLDVVDRKTGQVMGQLGDISTDGLLIIAKDPLPRNEIYEVAIRLPRMRGFSQDNVNMTVESRWISPDSNPDLSCTGCQVVDIDDQNRVLVDHLIEVLCFQE